MASDYPFLKLVCILLFGAKTVGVFGSVIWWTWYFDWRF